MGNIRLELRQAMIFLIHLVYCFKIECVLHELGIKKFAGAHAHSRKAVASERTQRAEDLWCAV